MRHKEMENMLTKLKKQAIRARGHAIPAMMGISEDLNLEIIPEARPEAKKYVELDKAIKEAEIAIETAFSRGAEVCNKLKVPLDSPPEPLQSLDNWDQWNLNHCARIEIELKKLQEFDRDSLTMKVKDMVLEQKLKIDHKKHLDASKAMAEGMIPIKALYEKAKSKLDKVQEIYESLEVIQKDQEMPEGWQPRISPYSLGGV